VEGHSAQTTLTREAFISTQVSILRTGSELARLDEVQYVSVAIVKAVVIAELGTRMRFVFLSNLNSIVCLTILLVRNCVSKE
jgi:hypothetical protein